MVLVSFTQRDFTFNYRDYIPHGQACSHYGFWIFVYFDYLAALLVSSDRKEASSYRLLPGLNGVKVVAKSNRNIKVLSTVHFGPPFLLPYVDNEISAWSYDYKIAIK